MYSKLFIIKKTLISAITLNIEIVIAQARFLTSF